MGSISLKNQSEIDCFHANLQQIAATIPNLSFGRITLVSAKRKLQRFLSEVALITETAKGAAMKRRPGTKQYKTNLSVSDVS